MPERYEIQDCIKRQKLEILENHNILADNAQPLGNWLLSPVKKIIGIFHRKQFGLTKTF